MTLETLAAFVSGGAIVASMGGVYYLIRYFSNGATVYDTSGNRLEADAQVPDDSEPTGAELVSNNHNNTGFLAVSLRLHDKWHGNDELVQQLSTDMQHSVDRLLRDIDICPECQQTGGRHLARCLALAEHVSMGDDTMLSRHKVVGNIVDERLTTKERQ